MRYSLQSLFAFEYTTALFNRINTSLNQQKNEHKILHEHRICYRTVVFELVLDHTS